MANTGMYKLYIGNKNYSSWSLRPWVLMHALAIPFQEEVVPFETGSSWKKFRDFSGSGLVPCLHDGETVVWDSLAITEYLAETHGDVWPSDRNSRAWSRSVVGEMHSGFAQLRGQCPMNCGVRVEMNEIDKFLHRDLQRIDEIWTEGLVRHGGPFLAGAVFSAVDAFFAPVAFRVQTYGLPLGDTSKQYVELMLQHPSMQNWYAAALQEPWREVHHEEEIAAAGRVTMDYRRG